VAGTASMLTNSGQLVGNVNFAASDTLNNTGAIRGAVTLGASDTLNDNGGAISGAVTVSTSDLLGYAGLFGAQTINNFRAGSGAGHDTIELIGSHFSNFGTLRNAMSQTGANTTIHVDATDTITLAGVNKTSLVAADFKFA